MKAAIRAPADCSVGEAADFGVWDGDFLNDEEDCGQDDQYDAIMEAQDYERKDEKIDPVAGVEAVDSGLAGSYCLDGAEDGQSCQPHNVDTEKQNARVTDIQLADSRPQTNKCLHSIEDGQFRRISEPIAALDQNQSILFTLPYEVRALIWTSVVGGGLVHITELRNTLGHVPCMDQGHQKWGVWKHDCWHCSLVRLGINVAPESYGKPENRWIRPGSLGLLRSCQQLYADAINVLYEHNTFCLRSMTTLELFLSSLTPERLEHITSLYLSPHIHSSYRDWDTTWTMLARIPNLKTLRVELRGKLKEQEPWAKARLLQAMCCVEQTDIYEVKVPWELEETREWLWASPFTLEGTYGEVTENGEREYLAFLRRERVDVKGWLSSGPRKGE